MNRKFGLKSAFLLFLIWIMACFAVNAKTFYLAATKGSIFSKLIGQWNVETRILWSSSPYAKIGAKADSEISIDEVNGRLYPQWKTADWVLLRNKSLDFKNDASFDWRRENKLVEGDKYWFVDSVDKFFFDENENLVAKSFVKQYLNGSYVGAYTSFSYLSKK
jgi:hypothetical protein